MINNTQTTEKYVFDTVKLLKDDISTLQVKSFFKINRDYKTCLRECDDLLDFINTEYKHNIDLFPDDVKLVNLRLMLDYIKGSVWQLIEYSKNPTNNKIKLARAYKEHAKYCRVLYRVEKEQENEYND